jgi:hypothetical protein
MAIVVLAGLTRCGRVEDRLRLRPRAPLSRGGLGLGEDVDPARCEGQRAFVEFGIDAIGPTEGRTANVAPGTSLGAAQLEADLAV